MKVNSIISKSLLVTSMLTLSGIGAVMAVDRNNEDEVVKVDVRMSRYDHRPNEVLVKFKPTSAVKIRSNKQGKFAASGVSAVDAILNEIGAQTTEQLMPLTGFQSQPMRVKTYTGQTLEVTDMSKLYRIKFDVEKGKSVNEVVEKLQAVAEVEFAEPNYIVYSTGYDKHNPHKDEPLYPEQWGLAAIKMPALWNKEVINEERPIIGILDTGVDIEHPDLAENIWVNEAEKNGAEDSDDDGNGYQDDLNGYDFVNMTARVGDWNGHGTHVAGIAAACGGNGIGVCGANPEALIMPVTVMQSDGTGDIATIIKGIDYAVANGADVINMSFGGYAYSIAEEQALAKAYQKAVLVAAAGNDCLPMVDKCSVCKQYGAPMFPAAFTFVLGVESSDKKGGKAGYSNYDADGPVYTTFGEEALYNYELRAPGSSIYSSLPGGIYKPLNGTSMASPLMAGAISRLLQCKEYASKELLFGDLIRSREGGDGDVNMLNAYNITDADRQPTLQCITYIIDDTEFGDGDGRLDAGETVDIYPTLRNEYGNAMNIRYSISLGDKEDPTIVEFINSEADFGAALSSYAKAKAVNPIRMKVNDECVDGRHIVMQLNATCDNISAELTQEMILIAENGVEIGGMITEDLTLYPNVHYIVTKPIGVPEGVTLTILPGTVLKFKAGTGLSLAKGSNFICNGEPGNMITFTMADHETGEILGFNGYYSDKFATISYCSFNGFYRSGVYNYLLSHFNLNNCIIVNNFCDVIQDYSFTYQCNIYNNKASGPYADPSSRLNSCNMISQYFRKGYNYYFRMETYDSCNLFNNYVEKYDIFCAVDYFSELPSVFQNENYYGTSIESIARERIIDMEHPTYPTGFGYVDLSYMLKQPSAEAHGIVWKVVVNGYDAQDEYDLLPPLGVGRHKFEVYFNRPMNKEAIPMIAMGVRPPYTQKPIAEDGSWNEEGTIYTAYLTISGQDDIDGVNRIYVAEAEDNEYFEIPIEDVRFNVNVQSAGSMSSGFMAEAALGKVNLTWDNPEENFDDMLGYNLYRYQVNDNVATDSIRINKQLLMPEETAYTDFDVVPGQTYYYFYKVLRTSLKENSPSKIVAATSLTASKGDANGSMSVDVADVVTEVAYMTNQDPKPFIFEAADVNSDLAVNIFDIVGTVNIIKNPNATNSPAINSVATYTVEDGVLYLESPVALAGVQFRLSADKDADIKTMESLSSFEVVTDYQEETGWLVLAYSLSGKQLEPGKHALLTIGDAKVTEVALSDPAGRNVMAVSGDVCGAGAVEAMQMQLPYPNPFSDTLNIPFVIGQEGMHDVKINICTPAGLNVATYNTTCDFGYYNYLWTPTSGNESGIYFVTLYVNDRLMQTTKVIYKK